MAYRTKMKASITLAGDLLEEVDELAKSSSRSEVIEQAVREFLAARARATRDARDLEIMNARADAYNAETADLLTYQGWVELDE
jgi:metal-responsive CopG/Arc/MetJ family transcriptional regulator